MAARLSRSCVIIKKEKRPSPFSFYNYIVRLVNVRPTAHDVRLQAQPFADWPHSKIIRLFISVMQWFKSGVADQIIAAIRNEAVGRQKLAGKILKGLSFAAKPNGHHLWLSLPRQWNRADFVSHVLRDCLAVVGVSCGACATILVCHAETSGRVFRDTFAPAFHQGRDPDIDESLTSFEVLQR